MNRMVILLLISVLASCAWIYHQEMHQVTFAAGSCQCYCSDLCGPRDVKEDDTPRVDLATGICFCKMRDVLNYVPNGCYKKPKVAFTSCCDR